MSSSAPISVLDKGADNTGVANSSAAFNAAILEAALNGGGIVVAPYGDYLLTSPVIIPSNVELNLCNSVITGPGIGSATDLFQSGYLLNGAVVTNIGTPPETVLVTCASVKNATIQNCGKAFNLYYWIDNCEVSNIRFINCTYAVYTSACFYSRFINLFSRGTASNALNAAFYFSNFVNVCQIESVFAVNRQLGIEVAFGANGQVLLNCSAESCVDGIKISNETGPIKFDTCYFELITGIAVNIDTAEYKYNVTLDNCFFNVCTTAIKGTPAGSGSVIFIRENNRFIACTTIFNGADNLDSIGKVEISPTLISNNGYPSIPATWVLGSKYRVDHDNINFDSSSGLALIRTKVHGTTLIPFEHEGNPGEPKTNTVAFCEHSKSAGTSFSIFIDTKIAYKTLSSLLVYRLTVTDNIGSYQMYGLILGDQVNTLDATGKTVAVSNNGGFVRLTLSTFSHPAGEYSCTGVLRHL
jgi:hypothetical protein